MATLLRLLVLLWLSAAAVWGRPSPQRKAEGSALRVPTLLPERIVAGYFSWSECDDKAKRAAQDGVNVLIWFAINLLTDPETGLPVVTGGPDLACVASARAWLQANALPTVHLISVGGWDAPHPSTTHSAAAVYAAWDAWNRKTLGGEPLFDGLDWDIEGNDDVKSPFNSFTAAELALMGGVSQRAKRDGFVVSLVPAESYLDAFLPDFSLSLLLDYPEWRVLQPNFKYHGRNVYAALLAGYGLTATESDVGGEVFIQTFDFVTVQLYESYSHARYNLTVLGQSWPSYLTELVRAYDAGWRVGFEAEPSVGLPSSSVAVPPGRLLIGLANGWAPGEKSLLILPEQLREGQKELDRLEVQMRGYAFWDIADEGLPLPDGTPLYLAAELGAMLGTRTKSGEAAIL